MDIAKSIAEKARAAGKVAEKTEYLAVTDKKKVEVGGVMVDVEVPNGQHKVTVISEKIGVGKSFEGAEQQQLQMEVLDNGVKKLWNIPIKNADGTLYYLIEKLEQIEKGEEFIIEAYKMKNGKYGKNITKVAGTQKELPTIQLDDTSEADSSSVPLDEDVPLEDIPF